MGRTVKPEQHVPVVDISGEPDVVGAELDDVRSAGIA
jgi:hypothetical protein